MGGNKINYIEGFSFYFRCGGFVFYTSFPSFFFFLSSFLALLLGLGLLYLVMISNAFCDGVFSFSRGSSLFALHGARVGFAYCYTIA